MPKMNAASQMPITEGVEAPSRLYLGCPLWGQKGWAGTFYRSDARPREFLAQYASVFNTVEGNTTFYSLPSRDNVVRWRDQTLPDFRFSFKFPQRITHELELRGAEDETTRFLRRIAPLGGRIGPLMLQFPKALSPADVDVLWDFLPHLPKDFKYAVELRHPGFFLSPRAVAQLDEKLQSLDCGRVIMDTRPVRSGAVVDDATRDTLRKKPDLPVYPGYSGAHPMIRFIGHPTAEVNEPWLQEWVGHLSRWIREGAEPYFFVHCPGDLEAPVLARRFHSLLNENVEIQKLPLFPCETEGPQASQLELF